MKFNIAPSISYLGAWVRITCRFNEDMRMEGLLWYFNIIILSAHGESEGHGFLDTLSDAGRYRQLQLYGDRHVWISDELCNKKLPAVHGH